MPMNIKQSFPNAVISKSSSSSNLMNFLSLDSEVKSWLLAKFTEYNGKLNAYKLSEYIKSMRYKSNEWNIKLLEARHSSKGKIKLLTKVQIIFDYANDLISYSLPEYGFPKKMEEAQVDWSVISDNKRFLLNPDGAWGEIELHFECGALILDDFKPLCPYTYDLNDYRLGRIDFSVKEWIDILLSGFNFNPEEFDEEAKLTLLQRFLPMVEKRLNAIELAIKGSAKSYCYSQLSPYTWLTSGTISRATAFYNNTTKKTGYFSNNDVVTFDEIQSIRCTAPEEMTGMMKAYLENGEIRVGSYCGHSDASMVMLGNIDVNDMDIEKKNMFKGIPSWLKESALIDRFALIIDGKKIGRFTEERKFEGVGLSSEYLSEIFHLLRDEFYYRSIVDEIIEVDGRADARNLEAVKKICSAYLKLLFPHVTSADDIDKEEFRKYCLEPAIKGRIAVLSQLRFLDEEYENVEMPVIKIKGEE